MTSPKLPDLLRNYDALTAEVSRLQTRRIDASQRHSAAIKEQNAVLSKLTAARDDDLAAIDKELDAAKAKASQAFDAVLDAKRSGKVEG